MNVPAFMQTCCLSAIYRLFQSHLESEVAALTFSRGLRYVEVRCL